MAFPLAALASAASGFASGGGSGSGIPQLGALAGAATNAAGSLTGASGGAAGVTAALTGLSAASGGLSAKFTEIVNTAARFVTAFDPAIVAELNRAFRQLDAVIGTALRPVIASAIDIVRGFGGAIYGTMQQLQPVVAKLAESIASALQPAFNNFGAIIEALVPVLDVMTDVAAGVMTIFGDLANTMRPFIYTIIELGKQFVESVFGVGIGGQIQDLFGQVREAIKSFVTNMLLAVASFLKLIGATKTLDALIKGVKPREVKDIQGAAAPQNAAFSGLADVAKQLTLAAFTATAGGGKGAGRKQEDILAGIEGQLQAIAAGDMSNLTEQAKAMLGVLTNVAAGATAIYNKCVDIYDKLPSASTLSGADEAAIDAKADQLRNKGGLKQYSPGSNDSFWKQLARS